MEESHYDQAMTDALPTAEDISIAALAKALGHPARVAIIRLLRDQTSCLCGDLVELLPFAQSTISQHLKQLKEAGWIVGEVDGPRVCYCLNGPMAAKFANLINILCPSPITIKISEIK